MAAYTIGSNGGLLIEDYLALEHFPIGAWIYYSFEARLLVYPKNADYNGALKAWRNQWTTTPFGAAGGGPLSGPVYNDWIDGEWQIHTTEDIRHDYTKYVNFGWALSQDYLIPGQVVEIRHPMITSERPSAYIAPGPGAPYDDFVVLGRSGGNRGGYPSSSGGRSTSGQVVAPGGSPPIMTPGRDGQGNLINFMPAGFEGIFSYTVPSSPPPTPSNLIGGPQGSYSSHVYSGETLGGYFPSPAVVADPTNTEGNTIVDPNYPRPPYPTGL